MGQENERHMGVHDGGGGRGKEGREGTSERKTHKRRCAGQRKVERKGVHEQCILHQKQLV